MRTYLSSEQRGATYRVISLALMLGLSACGGGGGGSGGSSTATTPTPPPPPPPPVSAFPASSTLANVCTVEGEKKFVRSYMDEKYLWYRDIPTVDASLYTTVKDYFKALLVTTPDANNLPRDQFSFVVTKAQSEQISTGVGQSFGIEWMRDAQGRLRVSQIAPNSSASDAQMARGGVMVQVVTTNTDNWYTSDAGAHVQFWYSDTPGSAQRLIDVYTRVVQTDPVPVTSIVTSPGGKRAGYILFNEHTKGAQDKLINTARSLQSSGINELVLDMRYNSGGYLYVAMSLASMVGSSATDGKIFESLRFNDKRAAESADNTFRFDSKVQYPESVYQVGYALPHLNLRRVYILTSNDTCSASEAVVNGLRGVDIDVVLIGQKTCGKPYGFTAKDNCALTYYPIEFQGVNNKGFGDYSAGFAPTCQGNDDLDHALGQPQEGLLSSALYHLDHGSCAAVAVQKRSLGISPPAESKPLSIERQQRGRLLRPTTP